jgi:hypothetical protein
VDRGRQARNWRFVVAGAVVLAAVGGATLGFGAPVWVAAAIGAVTALVAATAVIRVDNARERRAAALEGRRRVLDTLRAAAAADRADAVAANRADVLGLLRADRSPMPFRGRVRELRELAEWRANERASPVLMLTRSA